MQRRIWIIVIACLGGCSAKEATQVEFQPRPTRDWPGAPNVERVVLRYEEDGTLRLMGSWQARGQATKPRLNSHWPAILNGGAVVFDYALVTAAGERLATDLIVASDEIRASYVDPQFPDRVSHEITEQQTTYINVAIPFHIDATDLVIRRLIPDQGAPIEEWERQDVGIVKLPRERKNEHVPE